MIYKIADFYMDIKFSDGRTGDFLADYASPDAKNADFCIEVSDAEIDFEAKGMEKIENGQNYSRGYLERLAILRKVCAEVINRDAFLIHGALIEYEGTGYLFCAQSGTGKTTHVTRWQACFGAENVKIINGDKPIIRFVNGEIYGYGTPWCGKEGYGTNSRTKLDKICFIERGDENVLTDIDEVHALQRFFSQIMVTDSANLENQLAMVDRVFEKVKMYRLKCNMDVSAAKVAYEGMR